MRAEFPGYYRPTEAQFAKLWAEAEFVLDTNVLLHIYRYGRDTRDHLLDLLGRLKDRLWIPYQVGLEFQTRRPDVVSNQQLAYDIVAKGLDEQLQALRTLLNPFRRHSAIDAQWIEETVGKSLQRVQRKLRQLRQEHPNLLHDDELRARLDTLFTGRIGARPNPDQYEALRKEAERRIKAEIPPGLRDKKKEDGGVGDVLIWLQLLEHARANKRPQVLVSDDSKDDWWLVHRGQTLGPRPELIEEVLRDAGVTFYMYSTDRFIEEAEKYFVVDPQPAVVEEVREIQQADIATSAERVAALRHRLEELQASSSVPLANLDWRAAFERNLASSLALAERQRLLEEILAPSQANRAFLDSFDRTRELIRASIDSPLHATLRELASRSDILSTHERVLRALREARNEVDKESIDQEKRDDRVSGPPHEGSGDDTD